MFPVISRQAPPVMQEFPPQIAQCKKLGEGAEGVAFRCEELVFKFFQCPEERLPSMVPTDKIPQLWNDYMKAHEHPELATAKITTVSQEFGMRGNNRCDHEVLITPYIPGENATPKQAWQANNEYTKRLGKGIRDAACLGNVRVFDDKPLIVDFGTATERTLSPWEDSILNFLRN